jgi:hypothetical protein
VGAEIILLGGPAASSTCRVAGGLAEIARIRPELTAFFGCLYYAVLRPAEAVARLHTTLALACDLRICSTAATFTTAFTGIGLTPDSGLSATLTRAVGAAGQRAYPAGRALHRPAGSGLGGW